jgi:hypothetical protein
MYKLILLAIAGMFLVACEPKNSPEKMLTDDKADKAAASENTVSPEDPDETVFDPMIGTMDRAKSVEDLGMARKNAMDEALEEADESADWE